MLFCFFNITSFFFVTIFLSYKYKKQIVQVLPITISVWLGLLLLLAILRCLSYIDYISVIIILLTLCIFLKRRKSIDFVYIKNTLFDYSFVLFVLVCIFLFFLLKNRAATNWDELGCWALEVKTLFLVDGFSLHGFHTIDGYSDYLPGQMLILWWFVHLSKDSFNESLMFVGFYIFYLSTIFYLICDILKTWNKKYIISIFLGSVLITSFLILPSAISSLNYEMLCVELLQSSLVGGILYRFYIVNKGNWFKSFDYVSLISLSFLLITLKDSSFILLVLLLVWGKVLLLSNKTFYKKSPVIIGAVICAVFMITWRLFVVYNGRKIRRKSVFTDNFNQLFFEHDDLFIEDSIKYIKSFFTSIVDYPLHLSDCLGIDLTVFSSICFIVLLFLFIARQNNFSKKYTVISIFMLLGSNCAYFLLVLFMHIFFFREDQYFNPYTMMLSINRYCEPLLLGSLIAVISLFIKKKLFNFYVVLCFILLTCDLITVKKWLVTYPNIEYSQSIKAKINKENSYFFDKISNLNTQRTYRILFIQDSKDLHTRFVRWFSCPNAVYFILSKDNSALADQIKTKLNENEYDFYFFNNNIFIDKYSSDNKYLFSSEELRRILF